MFSRGKLGGALFTVFFLAVAAIDYYRDKPLHPEFMIFVFLATLPWALPWIAGLVKSLKFGGLELSFRELQEQIREAQQLANATASVLATGVGKAPAKAQEAGAESVSHDVVAAEDEEPESAGANIDAGDPNWVLFGNNPVAGGRKLSATVKPFPGSEKWFQIHAAVVSSDPIQPLPDGTPVIFHLHPSFKPNDKITVEAKDGAAVIDRVAWGWFTVGAEVDGQRLGLPLNTVPGAPALFKLR